jgi:arabinofuranosyltransferase
MLLPFPPLLSAWGPVLAPALAAGALVLSPRPRERVVLALACAAFVAHAWLYWSFTVDDSFITFRFARSWIEGLGPVYQAGPRVEGITSFGWMALLAAAGRLGLGIEPAAKWLGILAAASTLPATHAMVKQLTGSRRLALAAALLLALNPLFASWSVAGMDTPLFAALLVWATWARLADRRVRGVPLCAALLGLSVWIRPEGFLFGTLVWLSLLAERRPGVVRAAAVWALTATAVALPFWLWRWSYYGAFFPNTFYAKMPDVALRVAAGVQALRDFALDSGPWTWMPLAASLVRLPARNARERLPWALLASFLVYVVWSGGDVLHLRFFVHVMPLVTVLWAAGLASLLEPFLHAHDPATPRGEPSAPGPVPRPLATRLATAALLVAAACALGAAGHARATRSHAQLGAGYVVNNARNVQQVGLPLGEWLRTNAPAGSRLATWDIGGVGWSSRLPILDLYGLTDAAIAHHIHERAPIEERIAYVLDARPELVVTYAREDGPVWSWLAPAADTILARYRYHSVWRAHSGGYRLVLLERKDLALPALASAEPATAPPGR